jgi:hypothetical protein
MKLPIEVNTGCVGLGKSTNNGKLTKGSFMGGNYE